MGSARWSDTDWASHSVMYAAVTSHAEVYHAHGLDAALDPSKFKKRESFDSEANPLSTPIIIAADNTGSMGDLATHIIKKDLGVIMGSLYEKRPVSDPHILCLSIGDAEVDPAPIQATQFEASVAPIVEQLLKVWVVGGGGGNQGESYPYAWAFAAYKTNCDAIRKRGRKGYLFTIGDECPLPTLHKEHLKQYLNLDAPTSLSAKVLLADVQKDWEVFHLIVKPVPHQPVLNAWNALLGNRAIVVENIALLGETVTSIIELNEGHDPDEVGKDAAGKAVLSSEFGEQKRKIHLASA